MEGRRYAGGAVLDVAPRLWARRRSHADTQLCRDARGGDGGVRQELPIGPRACR
jgi:hypothetical protein